MNAEELSEQIAIELDALTIIVTELEALQHDTVDQEPTLREQTAAGAFLAQFYSGIENILKRVCAYNDIALPAGAMGTSSYSRDSARRLIQDCHCYLMMTLASH